MVRRSGERGDTLVRAAAGGRTGWGGRGLSASGGQFDAVDGALGEDEGHREGEIARSPDVVATTGGARECSRGKREAVVAAAPSSASRKGGRRETARSSKGLRLLSTRLCERIRNGRRVTYNEIADEMVEEYKRSRMVLDAKGQKTPIRAAAGARDDDDGDEASSCDEMETDPFAIGGGSGAMRPGSKRVNALRPCMERTIRRRIYDCLNVLLAVGAIERSDGKYLQWCGMPSDLLSPRRRELQRLRARHQRLRHSVAQKRALVRELAEQQAALLNLVARNQRASLDNDSPAGTPAAGNSGHSPQTPSLDLDDEQRALVPLLSASARRRESDTDSASSAYATPYASLRCNDALDIEPHHADIVPDSSDNDSSPLASQTPDPASAAIQRMERNGRIGYPFVVLHASVGATIDVEMSADRVRVRLDVDEPFSLVTDAQVATSMNMHGHEMHSVESVLRSIRTGAGSSLL
ncbi:hypothetical protein CDCA_CDCA08G2410 [Cyanidium caldarium]|uniref:Uncharacterized protein n=1 Tax=Cyanidium caldarium TaxID=2771 RepID=A0AAV9IWB1_CYACA|nr:hypothetical protein CDCA_CDCA08G2410 [Cyanidium caldarium]|eukprot:ctg_2229.g493